MRYRPHPGHGRRGFTLLELLVVIVILVILMLILLPEFLRQSISAKDARAKSYLTLAWQDLMVTATADEANFASASELAGELRYTDPSLSTQVVTDCSASTMASFDDKKVAIVGPQTNGAALVMCVRSSSGNIYELVAPVSGADPTIVLVSSIAGQKPVNIAAPTITGDVRYGQRLTAQEGGWESDTPPTYSYQWERCDNDAANCVNIAGGSNRTYLVGMGDVGDTFKVLVTAANAAGSATATSAPTGSANTNLVGLPDNTALPTISGTAAQGQTMSADKGSWTGNAPISYGCQWQDSSDGGNSWNDIAGASSCSYTIPAAEDGNALRVEIAATNREGEQDAYSAATGAVIPPPSNTALPQITGTAQDGQTLNATNGSWTASPTGYAYQWQLNSGSGWSDIGGATSSSYTIPYTSDVGDTFRVQVTATNAAGSTVASSNATAADQAAPPTNSAAPSFTGTAKDGQTLAGNKGSWLGTAPIVYSYQWQYSTNGGSTWSNLAGATSSSYTIQSSDVGDNLRLQVLASNSAGLTSATSGQSPVVAPAPPANTVAPTFTGTAKDGQTLTGAHGTWSGTPTISYSYQWQYSANGGGSWSNITGATAITYTIPYGGYTGDILRLNVIGTNAGGNSSASSAASAAVAPAPPTNTSPPQITGVDAAGQTLTVNSGSWTGTPPIAYSYQWQRSTDGGATYSDIAGATAATYALTSNDVNYIVRAIVTAHGSGTVAANSNPTGTISGTAPVNTAAPAISGSAQAGSTLTATAGTWSAAPPNQTYAYQWQTSSDGGGSWSNLAGATTSNYTASNSDIGNILRIAVTATNSCISGCRATTAYSTPTATVASEVPVGALVAWAGSSVPAGWTVADGSCGYSSTSYAALWTAIGSTYGGSSGNFCLPNMRGRFPLGKAAGGTGSVLGQTGGALDQTGIVNPWGTIAESYSWSETPPAPAPISHSHSDTDPFHSNYWINNWYTFVNQSVTLNANDETFSTLTTNLSANGSTTPWASYSVSNPPYVVVRYLISVSASAVPPCGALWGYGGSGAPSGSQLANGSAASGSLPACLDPSYGGAVPDLRGKAPIGQASSGSAATLAASGGSISQSVSGNLNTASTQATVTPSPWSATLVEGTHSHSISFGTFSHTTNGGAIQFAYDGGVPPVGNNSNAGSQYSSSAYSPGSLAAAGAGAQSPTSSTFNTAFETLNWVAYSSSSYAPAVGTITPYAGSAAPAHWLLADGSCYSTASYTNLFSALGYTYGGSGGSFCVPDLRGRFPLGVATSGTGSALGASGGTLGPSASLSFSGWTPSITIPAHGFAWSVPAHTHTIGPWRGGQYGQDCNCGNGELDARGPGQRASSYAGGGTVSSNVSGYSVNAAAIGAANASPSVSPPPFTALNMIVYSG